MRITARVSDAPTAIILQFAGTFTIWVMAEKLGLSSILTVVAYAVTTARTAPAHTPARLRVPAYAVWDTAVFILNVLAFMLIGMQLRPIWMRLDDVDRLQYAEIAACILATVILARILWLGIYGSTLRILAARGLFRPSRSLVVPTIKSGAVIAWCGMRGIVTLAAAFALPEAFPYRDLILLAACSVVLGTLVIQGLTLRPLILWLAVDDGDPLAHEVGWARRAAFHAALESFDGNESAEAQLLRLEYRQLLDRAENNPDGLTSGELPADPLRRQAIGAARRVLLEMRDSGEIGDDAFHRLEEEFDWAELSATRV
jgi:CPA1 family monovalent cation:H+ antiporter